MSRAGPSNTNWSVLAIVALVVIAAAPFVWAREVSQASRP
jgi:hypothetical protein